MASFECVDDERLRARDTLRGCAGACRGEVLAVVLCVVMMLRREMPNGGEVSVGGSWRTPLAARCVVCALVP